MKNNLETVQKAVKVLKAGGIIILRTDTLYGILACADDENAVEKVYKVKGRTPSKSCIVLLDSYDQAYGDLDKIKNQIDKYSDRPTSFLVESKNAPKWLLRANELLAYRLPNDEFLKQIIRDAGPLVAPSANPEGMDPAENIEKAKKYFGEKVDMYIDGGEVPKDTTPSRILLIQDDGSLEKIR